jgi:NAD(P)-dependent dehydrogenase (short-subunit alcohol dehydrogenase family)
VTARSAPGPQRQVPSKQVHARQKGGGTLKCIETDCKENGMAGKDLQGKIALVTGAQQGIGRSIAIAFAEAGANVAINYLDDLDAAKEVAAAVGALGRRAILLPGDVTDLAACEAMIASTVSSFGGIDILVNNAGVFPRVPFLALTETDWDVVMDVNLKGTFFCAQAAARAMVAAGRPGEIINLASQSVTGVSPHSTHYSASKGGVVSLTRAMALELAPHSIRVNAIAPGLTNTAQPRYGHSEDELREMASLIPLGRMGQPEDIAALAVFLASEKSAFMTGQTVHANGGTYMPS